MISVIWGGSSIRSKKYVIIIPTSSAVIDHNAQIIRELNPSAAQSWIHLASNCWYPYEAPLHLRIRFPDWNFSLVIEWFIRQAEICARSKVWSLDSCICIKTPLRNIKGVWPFVWFYPSICSAKLNLSKDIALLSLKHTSYPATPRRYSLEHWDSRK